MTSWPRLSILLPTFRRPAILQQTIQQLRLNVRYSGEYQILVGDDGGDLDPDNYSGAKILRSPQRGLGANLNFLLQEADDVVFQMDDDHWLMQPLELDAHVSKLMVDPSTGAIRLMGIGGHRYTATLDGLYWRISWDSPELYICSNRPHLKRKYFHHIYGPYTEGLSLGKTEETFCHQAIDLARNRSRASAPNIDVLIPLDVLTERSWQHVGISWQSSGL